MNQRNARSFGEDQGSAMQYQTVPPFADKAEYVGWGEQCAAFYARSQKSHDLFLEGWAKAWKEPQQVQEEAKKVQEVPWLDLGNQRVVETIAEDFRRCGLL